MFTFRVCLLSFIVLICHATDQASINEGYCECVPFYLCVNRTININGEGIIDIRRKRETCSGYLEVCCKKNNIIDTPTTTSVPRRKKSDCGFRNSDGAGYRITGDRENKTQFGQLSWIVAVFRKDTVTNKPVFKCGGSLVHPQVVLTAAHCVDRGGTFMIRAGDWTQTTQEIFKYQDGSVVSVRIHPRFVRKNLHNDVALLFLESPVDIAKVSHTEKICLPLHNSIALSDRCFVTKWGKDWFNHTGQFQVVLKKIQLPLVDRKQCQKDFRKTKLGPRFKLHRSFLCAGGGDESKDICIGNGGEPLICPISGEEGRYQQVGIVAWGVGCAIKGVPKAYVHVAYFRSWINKQINKNNFLNK